MKTADEQEAVRAIRDEFAEHRAAFHWFIYDALGGRCCSTRVLVVSILRVPTGAGGVSLGHGGV